MKRIYITENQLKKALKLKETINMSVDKKPGQDLDSAARDAFNQAKKDAPGADINLVVSGEELNEDVEDVNIPQQVVDFIVNNYADQLDDMTPVSEVYSMIRDAFFEVTGKDVENEEMEEEVFQKLHKKIVLGESQNKTISFTKKQIKEAKKAKRIQESKVLTKGDILKSLK